MPLSLYPVCRTEGKKTIGACTFFTTLLLPFSFSHFSFSLLFFPSPSCSVLLHPPLSLFILLHIFLYNYLYFIYVSSSDCLPSSLFSLYPVLCRLVILTKLYRCEIPLIYCTLRFSFSVKQLNLSSVLQEQYCSVGLFSLIHTCWCTHCHQKSIYWLQSTSILTSSTCSYICWGSCRLWRTNNRQQYSKH